MRVILSVAVLCAVLAACGSGPPDFEPVAMAVPAGEGSGEPHLAVTPGGQAVLSWLEPEEAGHALRYAKLDNDGWSPAATVARGERWFVNWADFPSVVPLSDTLWAAHWLVRQPAGGYAYDVMVSLSTDAGATWGEPFSPHTDGTATEHGFVTLFPWQGSAGAAWLDGRNMAAADPSAGAGHEHGEGGMTLRAALLGSDGTLSSETLVDDLACDCCQTDAALGAHGPILVYRDRTEEEIRDIYAVRATGESWGEPVRVAADDWQIDGCPVNGPATAARGRTVVVAWFTGAGGQPRVRLVRSEDGGDSFGGPMEIDADAPLGRVDVELLADGAVVVSWLRPEGETGAAIVLRRVEAGGMQGPIRRVAMTASSRMSGFPQMVLAGRQLVLAWTEADDQGTRVRGAVVDPTQL